MRSPPASWSCHGRRANVISSQSISVASARASSSGKRSPPPSRPPGPNGVGATWMTRMLVAALLTLGDPGRLTGGYLYHRRMAEAAPRHAARIEFVSFPERPFPLALLDAPRVLGRARTQGAQVLVL